MGKYDPLEGHLRRQKSGEIELSFAEIERIIGAMLPASAADPRWWINEAGPHRAQVQARAWLAAGFRAEHMPKLQRVRFTRIS